MLNLILSFVATLNSRKKFVAVASVFGAFSAVIVMSAITGIPLAKSILTAIHSPNPQGLSVILNAFAISIYLTLAVFLISRWSNLTDEISAMREELKRLLLLVAEKAGAQLNIVKDDARLWAGLVGRLISDNATFLAECKIQVVAGGLYRISVDDERVRNFLERLTKRMTLVYIIYLPKNVVGSNPAICLLRLTHIIRVCRDLAAAKGLTLKATVRLIVVNAPRPVGSVFIGRQVMDGSEHDFAREYYRDIDPLARDNTPTADRMLIQHVDSRGIDRLREMVEKAANQGVEIDFCDVERVLSKLLPKKDGGTAPIISTSAWNRAVKALYQGALAKNFEAVEMGDHFTFNEIRPSVGYDRGRGSNVANPPPGLDDIGEIAASQ